MALSPDIVFMSNISLPPDLGGSLGFFFSFQFAFMGFSAANSGPCVLHRANINVFCKYNYTYPEIKKPL